LRAGLDERRQGLRAQVVHHEGVARLEQPPRHRGADGPGSDEADLLHATLRSQPGAGAAGRAQLDLDAGACRAASPVEGAATPTGRRLPCVFQNEEGARHPMAAKKKSAGKKAAKRPAASAKAKAKPKAKAKAKAKARSGGRSASARPAAKAGAGAGQGDVVYSDVLRQLRTSLVARLIR
jgi:hypothetical protein